jgi:hypothetical protein
VGSPDQTDHEDVTPLPFGAVNGYDPIARFLMLELGSLTALFKGLIGVRFVVVEANI